MKSKKNLKDTIKVSEGEMKEIKKNINLRKLIDDLKSELPHEGIAEDYDIIDAFFYILDWRDDYDVKRVREFIRSFFMLYYGRPHERGAWLDKIYNIIDGKLV